MMNTDYSSDDIYLTRVANSLAASHARMLSVGAEAERERLLPLFRAIFAAFERAATMTEARIPSVLTAAIVAAKEAIGER